MKTQKVIRVGELMLVLRSDGGLYLGHPEALAGSALMHRDMVRIGSSGAICSALSAALLEMEQHIRAAANEPAAPAPSSYEATEDAE